MFSLINTLINKFYLRTLYNLTLYNPNLLLSIIMGNCKLCKNKHNRSQDSLNSTFNSSKCTNRKIKTKLLDLFHGSFTALFSQNAKDHKFLLKKFKEPIEQLILQQNIDTSILPNRQSHYQDLENQPNTLVNSYVFYSFKRQSLQDKEKTVQAYHILKHILKSRNNLFQMIINEYQNFLQLIIIIYSQNSNQQDQNGISNLDTVVSNPKNKNNFNKLNFLCVNKIKNETINEVFSQMDEFKLEKIIKTYLIVYELLDSYIKYSYYKILQDYLPSIGIDEKQQMKNYQVVGNLVEYFLLSKNCICSDLIKPLLLNYYKRLNDQLIDDNSSNSSISNRDSVPLEYYIQQTSLSYANYQTILFNQEQQLNNTISFQYLDVDEQEEERYQENKNYNNSCIFELINKIIRERRFWKKYDLTNDLDDLIYDIHLQYQRKHGFKETQVLSEEQEQKIYRYILREYASKNKGNLMQLYSELSFMNDNHQIIRKEHKDKFGRKFKRLLIQVTSQLNLK